MNKVIHGDCIQEMGEMGEMQEASVHSIVTDAPYALGFMGKKWDSFTPYEYHQFCYQWGKQALRVLKPGGYLLAFGGTRTYHRLVCGLEDAGFDIIDQIDWVYGSGFPKSHNISKAIDQAAGAEREKIGTKKFWGHNAGKGRAGQYANSYAPETGKTEYDDVTAPATEEAKQWDGWGTALKPGHEPIVVAQKPLEDISSTELYNLTGWDYWITEWKRKGIKYIRKKPLKPGLPFVTYKYDEDDNLVDTEKEPYSPWSCCNYAANVIKHGTGGFNIDGCRVPISDEDADKTQHNWKPEHGHDSSNTLYKTGITSLDTHQHDKGRFPANVVHDGSYPVTVLFPHSEGQQGDIQGTEPSHTGDENTHCYGEYSRIPAYKRQDTGSAARFFYCTKASKHERNAGLEDLKDVNYGQSGGAQQALKDGKDEYLNDHIGLNRIKKVKNDIATLKPINLMRWLVRLVTPKDGIVLDPFGGSGTTGCAAAIEGVHYILIEKRERFAETIAPLRISYWSNPEHWDELPDHKLLEDGDRKQREETHKTLDSF